MTVFAACPCCAPSRHAAARGRVTGARSVSRKAMPAPKPRKASPRRIDVHHHIVPPAYKALGPARDFVATWTPEVALEDMDKSGTETAITCIYAGSALAGHPEARRVARECNEYAARLGDDHPGRFGMFATLPFPDVDGCLREIEYALDVLKADGIYTQTSYGKQYLGDEAFAPIWDELNRRKAVVFAHPHTPEVCEDLIPGVPGPIIEYGTDTTRAIASLLFSGTATRTPDLDFIFCHAGGTMPFIIERFTRLAKRKDHAERLPRGVLPELRRFYYEVAQAAHPGAMRSFLELAKVSQLLFGTDFPYRTARDIAGGLAKCGFSAKELQAIDRGNALRLFPRFR
jgi:predicted TIM-barrel fold metal-dependent hydrolase